MLKQQIQKLKENWLLLLVVILILAIFNFNSISTGFSLKSSESFIGQDAAYGRGFIPYPSQDFAPNVEERKLTKDANLGLEIKRGTFQESQNEAKSIITKNNALLLNENSQKIDTDKRSYFQGSYQIKVPIASYQKIIDDLKSLGEITSFSENTQDITGEYLNLQDELKVETERLERYRQLFSQSSSISDQITLEDRIFDQERRIAYLEEMLTNSDKRVEYSTIYLTLTEAQSEYINAVFIKFSELITGFVNSINNLFYFVFAVIPYVLGIGIIILVVRYFKRR